MTKLFHVDITYSVMVAADNERDAEIIVEGDLRDILYQEPPDITCVSQVTKVSAPFSGSLPWGDNPDEHPCEYFTGEEQ